MFSDGRNAIMYDRPDKNRDIDVGAATIAGTWCDFDVLDV